MRRARALGFGEERTSREESKSGREFLTLHHFFCFLSLSFYLHCSLTSLFLSLISFGYFFAFLLFHLFFVCVCVCVQGTKGDEIKDKGRRERSEQRRKACARKALSSFLSLFPFHYCILLLSFSLVFFRSPSAPARQRSPWGSPSPRRARGRRPAAASRAAAAEAAAAAASRAAASAAACAGARSETPK